MVIHNWSMMAMDTEECKRIGKQAKPDKEF
jgi:hypothetical protein